MLKIGLLHTTIRAEEKLLLQAAKKRGVAIEVIDVRAIILDCSRTDWPFDVVLERCISTVKGAYAIHYFESLEIPAVNSSKVGRVCEDKYLTSLALEKAGITTPKFAMTFSEKQAVEAIESIGSFPVVIKPPSGSWGRLLAKVNDKETLETVLEHKMILGSPMHGAFYIQKYIDKKGFDIRAFVIDQQVICAISRKSDHWITNTARGGKAENYKVTKALQDICKRASEVVGGGVLAIDLMETDDGYTVNEINHTMEFRNSETPTGVSISGAIIDYCIKICQKK